ncbi:MAG: hypothetical protein KTR31_13200 [Myxococcales bacterium]|nr:hypothetical protein [Myxococcales bacterium]
MGLPKSFLSGDPVLSLRGQWMQLQPYLLQPGDAALEQNQFGACYATELVASPWGPFYAERLRKHAADRGLQPLGRHGAFEVFQYRNVRQIEGIRDDGYELTLSMQVPVEVDGTARLPVDHELNLVLDDRSDGAEILAPVQEALRSEGSAPLWPLLQALGITHHLWQAPLAGGQLHRDDELVMYWSAHAISVRATYDVLVPPELVHLLG